MDCRLVGLPPSIKYIIRGGVVYLNARHSWPTLEQALEEVQEHLSNKKSASVAT